MARPGHGKPLEVPGVEGDGVPCGGSGWQSMLAPDPGGLYMPGNVGTLSCWQWGAIKGF